MPEDPRKSTSMTSGLGMVLGLSAQMVSITLVGGFVGWWIDKVVGTEPLLLVVGILAGGGGGIASVWKSWKRNS